MTDVDVVIWGAGLAGSQLANSLSQVGIPIVVIPRGPGSYPVLPGVGVLNGSGRKRASLEAGLLADARANGAAILREETISSLLPPTGSIRTVLTQQLSIETRCVVFADGADPRIGRERGFLPEWDPWQLVHFAWQQLKGSSHPDAVIAGSRQEYPWRGYLANLNGEMWLGVGWFLEHEMNSHVHITELLEDVRAALSIEGELLGDPQVEVVPYEPRHLAASFCVENVLAVGDLTGIVNPLSLRRTEISLKIGVSAGRMIEQWLRDKSATQFDSGQVAAVFRPYVASEWQDDSGPTMPTVPRPPDRTSRFGSLLQRIVDRTQR